MGPNNGITALSVYSALSCIDHMARPRRGDACGLDAANQDNSRDHFLIPNSGSTLLRAHPDVVIGSRRCHW